VPITEAGKQRSLNSDLAGGKRLEKHGDLLLIDALVKAYPAYNHDQIFELEYNFAMALILMNKEMAYTNEASNDIGKKIELAKQKR